MDTGKEREADKRGQRLTVLRNMPEWEEFITLCNNEFESNYQKMLKGSETELWEARGGIKAIERVLSKMKDSIKYGQECRKKIWNSLTSKV